MLPRIQGGFRVAAVHVSHEWLHGKGWVMTQHGGFSDNETFLIAVQGRRKHSLVEKKKKSCFTPVLPSRVHQYFSLCRDPQRTQQELWQIFVFQRSQFQSKRQRLTFWKGFTRSAVCRLAVSEVRGTRMVPSWMRLGGHANPSGAMIGAATENAGWELALLQFASWEKSLCLTLLPLFWCKSTPQRWPYRNWTYAVLSGSVWRCRRRKGRRKYV